MSKEKGKTKVKKTYTRRETRKTSMSSTRISTTRGRKNGKFITSLRGDDKSEEEDLLSEDENDQEDEEDVLPVKRYYNKKGHVKVPPGLRVDFSQLTVS